MDWTSQNVRNKVFWSDETKSGYFGPPFPIKYFTAQNGPGGERMAEYSQIQMGKTWGRWREGVIAAKGLL